MMMRRSRSSNSLVLNDYSRKEGNEKHNEVKTSLRRILSSQLISIEEARVVPKTSNSHIYNGGKTKKSSVIARSFFLPLKYDRFVPASIGFITLIAFIIGCVSMIHLAGNSVGFRKLDRMYPSKEYYKHFGGAVHEGYFRIQDSINEDASGARSYSFLTVTDLDQLSRIPGNKPMFRSFLLPGVLKTSDNGKSYSIVFQSTRELIAGQNEAGRGMELSELTVYQNRLFTFDDRTGAVFEILNKSNRDESYVTPRFIITEGDGETSKGMKHEWATVKGKDLYIGSMGKEYTRSDGKILNYNNLWISIITSYGEVRHVDWSNEYDYVRSKLGASLPGYCINEAVLWSEHMQKWMFLPRRISSEPYDEEADERRGSNKFLWVDDKFQSSELVAVKMKMNDPLRGFSSVAFIPNTNDRHALALRSVEDRCVGGDENLCSQRTYALVFDTLTGEVLMDEELLPYNVKFEGVEFVDIMASNTQNLK